MGPKKSSSNSTGKEERKIMRTTIELKKEIIAKFENGFRVSDFVKNKEAMKAADVVKGVMNVHSK